MDLEEGGHGLFQSTILTFKLIHREKLEGTSVRTAQPRSKPGAF
jgi:hypothetical protein